VVVVALAGALVAPTGAVPLLDGGDPVGEDVVLQPADGPNGDYAYLRDGELVVDLTAANPNVSAEGVNDGATTTVDDVFLIRYNGSRAADIWVTHDSEDVTLYARDRPIESVENNVTLGPNGTVAVGIAVDTSGGTTDGLLDSLTVHARIAEGPTGGSGDERDDDELTIQTSAPDETTRRFEVRGAALGESLTLDANSLGVGLENASTLTLDEIEIVTGDDEIDLTATHDGGDAASIAANGSEGTVRPLGAVTVDVTEGDVADATLRFSVSRAELDRIGVDPSGEDLLIFRRDSSDEGEVERLEATPVEERDGRLVFEVDAGGFSTFVVAARTPDVRVTDAELEPARVSANESATVVARVENRGSASGERTVGLALDGEVVAERTVALDPGNATTVEFSVSPEPGEYDADVEGVPAGTLRVEANATADTPAGTGSDTTTATGTATATEAGPTDTPSLVAEPAGVGPETISGLLAALGLVVGVLLLVRYTHDR